MKYTLKTILRSFSKKPVVNIINIFGLTVSLVLVIILSTYCFSELTTDTHHPKADRIYVVKNGDNSIFSPAVLKENIELKVPGVLKVIRIAGTWNAPVFKTEKGYPIESDLLFADPEIFDFFSYEVLEGDLSTALNDPLSIVISLKLKEKLFGDAYALGKTIKYNNGKLLTVNAVVAEPVNNSFLSFSAVTSIETRKILQPSPQEYTDWGWSNFQTFLLLDEGVAPEKVAGNVFSIYPESVQEWIENVSLLPLKDIYFAGIQSFGQNYFQQGNKSKTFILLFVAALILVIALVNFINITSSLWAGRLNQTGILKVIGASRMAIFRNFAFESFLLFFTSVIAALFLLAGVNEIIQDYTGIDFNIRLIYTPWFFIILIASTILLSILFSIVPGMRISALNSVDILKKNTPHSRKNKLLSGGLISLQMVISILLIAFTLLVFKQIRFGSDHLVFNHNNTVAIKLNGQLNKEILQNLLTTDPMMQNVTFTQFYPGKQISSWGGIKINVYGEEKEIDFETFSADGNFFKTLGLQLIQGNLYTNDMSVDKNRVVVNEEFVRRYGIEDPVGITFEMNLRNYVITGVIKDFHYKSVEKAIEPLAITNSDYNSYCLANIQATDFGTLYATVNKVRSAAQKSSPDFPVEISFMDDAVNSMYQSEVRFRRLFSLFAVSAIIICALGILAMSIFTAQQRIKEIGIRKVNGARVSEIMILLNNDFVKWVAVAFVVAVPVSYLIMNKWLENFAYKTSISWWIFALAGLAALSIALLTASWQSWRAANRNPVEALRSE